MADDPPGTVTAPASEDKLWLWNEPADIVADLVGAAIAAWFVRWILIRGDLGQNWFPLLVLGCFGVGVIYRVKDLRRRYRLRDRAREQQLLQLALRHEGAVTPAQAAAELANLGIDEAKAWLDRLARAGLCDLDSDTSGHLVYRFPLGEPDDREERHWRRLVGEEGAGVDVEA